jgi:hypothetical protein
MATKKSRYSLHPGFAREEAYRRNLEQRTGRSLEKWVELTRRKGFGFVKERVAWLKDAHGLTTDYARWIAEECDGATGASAYDPEALVAAMFVRKPALVPIYQKLLDVSLAIGADAKACPCATIVPIYRNHVIAQLAPTTLTRLDFGLSLGDPRKVKTPARLLDTGGFAKKDRITHRIPITKLDEVDGTVERWLKVAYERDA